MDPISQLIVTFLHNILQALSSPLISLAALVGNTPLGLTTANAIVDTGWHVMTAVADGLLLLFVLVTVIGIMYGQVTGTLYLPVSQFVPRMLLVAILMHLSLILGQDLLLLNNLLCGLVRANVTGFIQQANGGQLTAGQQVTLSAILGVVFALTFLRVVFQAIKRIVFFNLLFVLSAPAFLLSLHPATAPAFVFWARTYVTTIFSQFFQFLALGLGLQFLLDTKQTGLPGFLLAIAMLTLVAEIPAVLARFSASAGANASGIGSLVRTAITAAALLA